MGFDSVLRNGISLANRLTASLQVTVTHKAWTSVKNLYGKPVYSDGVSRTALLDSRTKHVRTIEGKTIVQIAHLTFLGTGYTIDVRDQIILPDGTTAPIFKIEGQGDPSGGRFLTEVYLGSEQ